MLLKHPSTDVEVRQPWVDLNASAEWRMIRNLRVRMFHRSNLPRIIAGTTGPPPMPMSTQFASTSSTSAVGVDEVVALEPWLADTGRWAAPVGDRVDRPLTQLSSRDVRPVVDPASHTAW